MTQKEVSYVPSFRESCAAGVSWPSDRYKPVRMMVYDVSKSPNLPWGHKQVLVYCWIPVVVRGQRFWLVPVKSFVAHQLARSLSVLGLVDSF